MPLGTKRLKLTQVDSDTVTDGFSKQNWIKVCTDKLKRLGDKNRD